MSTLIIRLSDIGEGVTEAEIVDWQVGVGDAVEEDQILGAVMTDKAAVDIPSPAAGVITSLSGQSGDVLAVGAELARLDTRAVSSHVDEQARSDRQTAPDDTPRKTERTTVTGEKPDDSMPETGTTASQPSAPPVLAAPAVRQRARERNIDLRKVKASADNGRISHADLDNHLYGTSSSIGAAAATRDSIDSIALSGIRRTIARRMEQASRHIPHFSYVEEIDVTELESLRRELNEQAAQQRQNVQAASGQVDNTNLSPLPFIVLAILRSLEQFPEINALYDEETDTVHRHSARHVGIATRTDQGLVVPVIRHAEQLGIHALSAEIGRLAAAARAGRLSREELSGSTITVTSLGALGGIASTPIINHPEVAIVGVNRIVPRVVMRHEQMTSRLMMNLSSSFDHRVIDGHAAALFVQRIRACLESPVTLFMLD